MQKRDYSLDFIKIIATIIIVFHHYQQVTGVIFDRGINFYNGIFYFGYVVELFFIISGYLMFDYIEKIYSGLDFKNFFTKRFIRIFPMMANAAIFYEFFLVIYQNIYNSSWFDIQPTFWGTIIASIGIQDGWVLNNPCVNNPTWYISVLYLCYIIFYFLVFISRKCKINLYYLFIFMIFLGMGINTYNFNLPFLNLSTARGYCAFFGGIILAKIIRNKKISMKVEIVSFIIVILIPILIIYRNEFMYNGLQYTLIFIFYPAIIVLLKSNVFQKILEHKSIGILGQISFEVYLWHNPFFLLMYILIRIMDVNLNLASRGTMFLFMIFCYFMGTILYFGVEKPIFNSVKNIKILR